MGQTGVLDLLDVQAELFGVVLVDLVAHALVDAGIDGAGAALDDASRIIRDGSDNLYY